LGDFLGKGSFRLVRNTVHLATQKKYAVKILELEFEPSKKIADIEKENMEKLKGYSPYLINLVECFDLVCGSIIMIFYSF
jgi:serine/threonine protein kinase